MSDELRLHLCEIEHELRGIEKRIAKMRADMVPPTVKIIVEAVAEYYGTKSIHILSQRRPQSLCMVRQVAMYLAVELTLKSHPVIGRAFGDRDHTTILSGVNKIKSLLFTDRKLAEDIECIKSRLKHAGSASAPASGSASAPRSPTADAGPLYSRAISS